MNRALKRLLLVALGLIIGLSIPKSAAAAQTIVSLTFDDGYDDAPGAAQIMAQFGMKGTFFIISGVLGSGSPYMTVSQVQALQAAGHEIAGHTITHRDLTTLSSTDAQNEICGGRTQLINMGFSPVNNFAYPFGAANSAVEAIVASCYKSGRGAWQLGCNYDGCSPAESIPPVDPYWIRTPDAVLDTTSLAQLEAQVTTAENAGGGWVPMQFHRVCNNDCDQYSTSPAILTSFLSWLSTRSSQGTVVQTVNQVMNGITTNPAPTLTGISPNSVTAGAAAVTLTLTGTNFIPNSTVQWNGSARQTTYVSGTTLTATITAADLSNPSTANVTVSNPPLGGGTSASQPFTITPNGSAPISIWGNTAPPVGNNSSDATNYNLGVRWRSDVNGNIVGLRYYRWAGNTGTHIGDLWTNTGTKLAEATFTGGTATGWQTVLFANPVPVTAGTTYVASYWTNTGFAVTTNYFVNALDNAPLHALAYATGSPNGLYGISANQATIPTSSTSKSNYWVDVLFTVGGSTPTQNPVPTLASISPSSATAGGAGFNLTLTGTNFINSSSVQWNGASLVTNFVNATTLTATVPAGNIVSTGTTTVTVFNPTPGGGTSNRQTFTINQAPPPPNPVPILTSIAPSSATTGSPGFTLTLNGTNFLSSSTVNWNGANRTTTFINSTSLSAIIPASDIISSGTATVTVFNPAPGGGTSVGQTFTINTVIVSNPVPTLNSISPSSAATGGSAFTLTLYGSNFISSSTVMWNGSSRITTFISNTTLTASILASDVASAGSASVTVFTPAPGGGTSAGQAFAINASTTSTGGPWTIWGSSAPKVGEGWKDPSALEAGVRFRSDISGYIKGIRFYKWSTNTGTHAGNLWTNTGTLLATITFTGETASGWQTAYFSNPVAISANTTYVASYFTTTGYAVTTNAFTVGVDNAPLHALASGVDGLNGLYKYSAASVFPTQNTKASNYWVDVVFNTTSSFGASISVTPPPVGGNAPVFTDFSQVREYPNPWQANRPNNGFITFDQMPPESTVKIFTVSAHWVTTLEAPGGSVTWNLTNSAGDKVASGYYIYLITSPNSGKTHGTLAIIR